MAKKDYLDQIHIRLFPQKISKGDRTKLRIIEACIECISKEGLQSITFESVGKKLRLQAPQIKYHFPEKDGLIAKAIEYALFTPQEFFVSKIEDAKSGKDKILALCNGLFDWADAHPEQAATYLLFFQLASFRTSYRHIHEQMYAMGQRRMEAILREMPAGELRKGIDIEQAASSLWALIDGFLFYRLSLPKARHATLRKQALQGILLILGGR